MSITKDQIIEAVAAMSVMDVVELISAMEEKFGVSAAAAVAVAARGAEELSRSQEGAEVQPTQRSSRNCSRLYTQTMVVGTGSCIVPFLQTKIWLTIDTQATYTEVLAATIIHYRVHQRHYRNTSIK